MRIEMLKYSLDQSSTDVHSWHILDERTEEQVQVRDGTMTVSPPPGVTLAVVPASAPPLAGGPHTIGAGTLQSEPECALGRFPPTHRTTLGTIFSLDLINIHSVSGDWIIVFLWDVRCEYSLGSWWKLWSLRYSLGLKLLFPITEGFKLNSDPR